MKILVMGAGAVGGFYGSILQMAGNDVTLVARGDHLDEIKKSGLRIKSKSIGHFTSKLRAVSALNSNWNADLILFTVKGFDNRDAIELIRPAVASDTIILTLQNGIGSGDELRRSFSLSKVLLGVTYIDAHKPSPGIVVESGDDSGIVLGETEDSNPDAVTSVHKVFNSAQINARVSKMIQVEVWNKLMFICALSGMSCIVRAGFENVLDNPETRDLTIRVMREVESLAMAKGIILDSNVVQSTMDRLDDNKSTLTSSMYTDLENGNRLEIEVLNGAVSKYASEIGLKTPVNDFITACLMVPHRAAIERANRS
tara:strand:- start:50 stop:988 length:939 start_codon:yes stop_codon:yes gene_type:complete